MKELIDNTSLHHNIKSLILRFPDLDPVLTLCLKRQEMNISSAQIEAKIDRMVAFKQMMHLVVKENAEIMLSRALAVKPYVNRLLERSSFIEYAEFLEVYEAELGEQHQLSFKLQWSNNEEFFIQLVNANTERVFLINLSESFLRHQKLKSGISFVTQEFSVEDRLVKDTLMEISHMSNDVLVELLVDVREYVRFLYKLSETLSTLDMLTSLALSDDFVKPEFGGSLAIKQGRHPILDTMAVANPLRSLHILTGPNMSSTYLRHVVLLSIMVQIGLSNRDFIEVEIQETSIIMAKLGIAVEEATIFCWAICEKLLQTCAFISLATNLLQMTCLADLHPCVTNHYFMAKTVPDHMEYPHQLAQGKPPASTTHYGYKISSWGHLIMGLKGGSDDMIDPDPSLLDTLDSEFSTIGDSFDSGGDEAAPAILDPEYSTIGDSFDSESDVPEAVIVNMATKVAPAKADSTLTVEMDKDDFEEDSENQIIENVFDAEVKEDDTSLKISVDNIPSSAAVCDSFAFEDENEGIKQYVSASALKVSESSVRRTPCCGDVCNAQYLTTKARSRVDEMVKGKSKGEIKTALLEQLHSQEKMDISTSGFLIGGQYLCKKYFSSLSEVSPYMVKEVFRAFEVGQRFFVHGNTVGIKQSVATIGFINWLKNFAVNYGNYAPDEQKLIISACFSIKEMFLMYKEQSPGPLVKKSSFYSLFKSKFGPAREDKSLPCVRLSSYTSHSRCDQCLLLERFQRSCQSAEDLAMSKSLKQEHRLTYVRARIAIEELRFKAINDPANHVYCQIDDMDNSKVRRKCPFQITLT